MEAANAASQNMLPKPPALPVIFENIPQELKGIDQWILWKYECRLGKWTKPPYQPDGALASSTDPSTWNSFEEIKAAYESGGYDGIGFVLTEDLGIVGIDLDNCLDNNEISESSARMVQSLDSYTEISPSGKGLRILVRGTIPENGRKRGDIEFYKHGRYLTITGHRIEGISSTAIEDRHEEVLSLFTEIFGEDATEEEEKKDHEKHELTEEAELRFGNLLEIDDAFAKRFLKPAPIGERSDREFYLCCYLYEHGFEAGEIYTLLTEYSPQEKWKERDDTYRWGVIDAAVDKAEARAITEEQLGGLSLAENPRLTVNLEPDNTIMRYIEYGKSTCDAYLEYHYSMSLNLLSISTNRNLVLKLSQDDVYPNIWSFNLGRSTISRKSAAAKKGEKFASELFPPEAVLPQSYSPEGLIEVLSKHPQSYLIKDEAAAMLEAMQKSYMLEIRDLYCLLYDNQGYSRKLRSGQRNEQREFIVVDPFVNIWCATTPASFREKTSMLDLLSGWLVRFLYFYPNYRKDWMAFKPASEEDYTLQGEVLSRISQTVQVFYHREEPLNIELSPEAWSYFQGWQEARERNLQRQPDDIELALWGRLSFYALKLSMLFTVGRSDYKEGTSVSLEHVREACRQVDEYFLPTGKIVAEEVALQESRNVQNRILGILKRKGGRIQRSELLRNLHLKVKEVEEALSALEESDEIERKIVTAEGKKPVEWIILKKKQS